MKDDRSGFVRARDWLFRSRETGRIVVGQRPNALLALFLVAYAASWLLQDGAGGRAAWIASRLFLALWAGDELLRGVNPWRRILGAGVLGYLAWTVLARG